MPNGFSVITRAPVAEPELADLLRPSPPSPAAAARGRRGRRPPRPVPRAPRDRRRRASPNPSPTPAKRSDSAKRSQVAGVIVLAARALDRLRARARGTPRRSIALAGGADDPEALRHQPDLRRGGTSPAAACAWRGRRSRRRGRSPGPRGPRPTSAWRWRWRRSRSRLTDARAYAARLCWRTDGTTRPRRSRATTRPRWTGSSAASGARSGSRSRPRSPPSTASSCASSARCRRRSVDALARVGMLNLVLGATEPGAIADGHLEAAIEWARGAASTPYVPVTPGLPAAPAAEAWLRGDGFEPGLRLDEVRPRPPPAALPGSRRRRGGRADRRPTRSRSGRSPRSASACRPGAPSFFADLPGRDGWRCYVARVDGEAQACAAMLIDDGVAEFGIAATLEPARGRGCQTRAPAPPHRRRRRGRLPHPLRRDRRAGRRTGPRPATATSSGPASKRPTCGPTGSGGD